MRAETEMHCSVDRGHAPGPVMDGRHVLVAESETSDVMRPA